MNRRRTADCLSNNMNAHSTDHEFWRDQDMPMHQVGGCAERVEQRRGST